MRMNSSWVMQESSFGADAKLAVFEEEVSLYCLRLICKKFKINWLRSSGDFELFSIKLSF